MSLNQTGKMIVFWYNELENKFRGLRLIEMVIMPNHIHFILNKENENKEISLSTMIQWFKTMTTNAYIKGVKEGKFQAFDKKVWQRNYYEHIIRDESSYYKLIEYIKNNPKTWKEDSLNTF